ncbi:MAG: exo-alpha-sialidase [Rhodospirillales bacterium]|nr:exo-alpha-sialidase [Rhodospirillales bacterium]
MLVAGPRIFLSAPEGKAGFAQCHAASILCPAHGPMVAAFFAGTKEGAGDTAIWITRRIGGEWQAPRRALAEAGLAHWNPVLHVDGARLLLFYKVGASVHAWRTRLAVSEDGGESWSAPRALVADDPRPRGPVKNKLLVLADGVWLAPGSTEDARRWDAFIDRSEDRGTTWQLAPIPLAHRPPAAPGTGLWQGLAQDALWESDPARAFAWDGVIQPSLWESAPGMVHALMRSTRGAIYRSDSRDGGRSWCEAYATALANNNSGLDVTRMADGLLVLACNPVAGNWSARSPLVLLISRDNGASWQQAAVLEDEDGEFSYPAIIPSADGGGLHIAYTWNRKAIVWRGIERLQDRLATT